MRRPSARTWLHRVDIERNTPDKDVDGGELPNYTRVATGVLATIHDEDGTRQLAAQLRREETKDVVITFPADHGLTVNHRIIHGSDVYMVHSTYDDAKQGRYYGAVTRISPGA